MTSPSAVPGGHRTAEDRQPNVRISWVDAIHVRAEIAAESIVSEGAETWRLRMLDRLAAEVQRQDRVPCGQPWVEQMPTDKPNVVVLQASQPYDPSEYATLNFYE